MIRESSSGTNLEVDQFHQSKTEGGSLLNSYIEKLRLLHKHNKLHQKAPSTSSLEQVPDYTLSGVVGRNQ